MATQKTYLVTGTIFDEHTVALDEPLPIKEGKVRLTVEPIATKQCSYSEVMSAIRERQRLRGFQPPTRAEVDAYIEAQRNSWGD